MFIIDGGFFWKLAWMNKMDKPKLLTSLEFVLFEISFVLAFGFHIKFASDRGFRGIRDK
jgi:hypothetical protein